MQKFEDVYLKMLNEDVSDDNTSLNMDYDKLCNDLNLRFHNLYVFLETILYLMEEAKNKATTIHGSGAESVYNENIDKLKEFQEFSRTMYRFFETDQNYDKLNTTIHNEDVMTEDITGERKTYTANELKSLFIRNFVNFCKMYKLDPAEHNDTFTVCKNAAQELFKMYKPALT